MTAQLPIFSTLTAWLFLDRVSAPGWVWGVVGTLFAVVWAANIWKLSVQKFAAPAEIKAE
jgi:hypothetical protein